MATIKDVARLAGVSVSTVSLVLNTTLEERRVSPKTWMKVQNAIDTLNYKPSRAARKLRKNEKSIPSIGLFWPVNYQTSLIGDALVCIQDAFDKAYFNCNIVVYMFSPKHLMDCHELTDGELLDGAIIGFGDTEDLDWLETAEIKLPIVMFNRQLKRYNFVRADNRAMGRVTAQLLQKSNCKTAALFHMSEYSRGIERRLEDFKEEYSRLGVNDYLEYTFNREGDYEAMIHQTQCMMTGKLPDAAVYFCSEQSTYTSISYLMRNGIRFPDDMKAVLVCLSPGNLSKYLSPTLTMVTASMVQMLSDCAQILIHQIKEKEILPIHKIYIPEVYYGETLPNKF
jgi:DNA-binding LacI/PurR family transcriptional regulator